MTPRAPLVSAILARNEATRYLPDVLDRCASFGEIVVLDDGSTDDTYELCRAHPAVRHVQRRTTVGGMWGRESPARAELWDLARQHGEWLLVCDADQLLVGDPRGLCTTETLNSWSFILYDVWDEPRTLYRDDGYWRAHKHPRPWLVRADACPDPVWPARGIHCGHLPANFPLQGGIAPPDAYYWLHLGYSKEADRIAKHAQYLNLGGQLTAFETAHAASIIEPATLRKLPSEQITRILVGASVRKPAPVLSAHLQTIAWQEKPERTQIDYCFVNDYPSPDPAETVLQEFVNTYPGSVVLQSSVRPPSGDFSEDGVTHQWTQTAMGRVANNKHEIFKYALDHGYDFVWLVDSDLLLDPTVLLSLVSTGKAVVSSVYWTRWNNVPNMKAAPQVWLAPVYQLSKGPYYPEWKFRRELADRGLIPVGGLGACTLIHKSVLEKGVNCSKPPQFPSGGLWDGEDRHFCEWCRRLHVEMWADAWPDIFHVYHPDDVQDIPKQLARLQATHPHVSTVGDLVSLRLTNIEQGGITEFVRGRIGTLKLLPEIEDAILGMRRGDKRLVKCHFGVDFPVENLRGKAQIVECQLIDCKPFGYHPVLEDEFHLSPNGVQADATTYTESQRDSLAAAD